MLPKLLATCASDSLRDLRDRAILMVAFASGGGRRSEIAGLRRRVADQGAGRSSPPSRHPSRSHQAHLRRAGRHCLCLSTGRPVEALNAWMVAAKIESGSVFRGIGRWGTISRQAIDPQSVNAILKQWAVMAGLDGGAFSAHGLRSGYLTEAANPGIPLTEAMEQSRHGSVQQASSITTMRHVGAVGPLGCSNRHLRNG